MEGVDWIVRQEGTLSSTGFNHTGDMSSRSYWKRRVTPSRLVLYQLENALQPPPLICRLMQPT